MDTIWTFEENQAAETEKVDMKPFKPTGRFFEDVQTLVRMFGIKTHPALRENSYRSPEQLNAASGSNANESQEDQPLREILALNFYKYRLDKASLRVAFLCLPSASNITTLKFSNNGLTHSQLNTLIGYLGEDNCPITNLFLDWNPVYNEEFKAGDSVPSGSNQPYEIQPSTEDDQAEEMSLFARVISEGKKLQVVFMRASGLKDIDLKHIMLALKPDTQLAMNRNLKVLDLSYNNFSGACVQEFASVFEQNRSLEFLGLAKNRLTTEDLLPILECFGKVPFPTDQVEAYQGEMKKRDAIIEKNKKLKQQKKPEEPIPILDTIESEVGRDADGNEATNWFLLRCPQFKHLNFCLNQIDDEIAVKMEDVLLRTPDDFGFTLSGNPISNPVILRIHRQVTALHKQRCLEQRQADANNSVIVEVEDIGQRRCAF